MPNAEPGDGADELPHRAVSAIGWCWWTVHILLWTVAAGLLIAALARVFFHDATIPLTWFNAFTRYVYVPAYLCVAWAIWQRRRWLAIVSIVVVAFHLVWLSPNVLRDRRFDRPPSDSPTVRIFFANVYAHNQDYVPIWREVAAAKPDVVILVECSRHSDRSFRQSPETASYVETNWVNGRPPQSQFGEVAVFSKLPIRSEAQNWDGGRIIQTVDVAVGEEVLRIVGLHAPRPQPPSYDYEGFWQSAVPWLISQPTPLVIVGDFNATEHSAVYQQLRRADLRSAHDDRGRGYATTWPNGQSLLPPIRIDQAFVSADVECVAIAEGTGAGSDHKPLILDVRIRGR